MTEPRKYQLDCVDAIDREAYGPFPSMATAQEWTVNVTEEQLPGKLIVLCLRKPLPYPEESQ